MAQPFDNIALVMNRRANQTSKNITRIMKAAAIAVDRNVVSDTPQDTGAAASNWLVSIDKPLTGVIPPYAPGMKLGKGFPGNTNAAIQQGKVAIGSFNIKKNNAIFISNNIDYIGLLNDGKSKQAKPLFVQRAIQRAVLEIKKFKLLDK